MDNIVNIPSTPINSLITIDDAFKITSELFQFVDVPQALTLRTYP